MTIPDGIRRSLCAAAASLSLAGCLNLGPESIARSRLAYNEAIQETDKQQVFVNLIRASRNEPATFVEVGQINASLVGEGSFTGALAGLGARIGIASGTISARAGSANLGFRYQEQPTVQLNPVVADARVRQLLSPVRAESLRMLSDSNWPIATLFAFFSQGLTPYYTDYGIALNAIVALQDRGVIRLSDLATAVAAKSTRASPAGPLALVIDARRPYLRSGEREADVADEVAALRCRLQVAMRVAETRCSPAGRPGGPSAAPAILPFGEAFRTRSADGVLRAIARPPGPLIAIVEKPDYDRIVGYPWNKLDVRGTCAETSFYTLLPSDEDPLDNTGGLEPGRLSNDPDVRAVEDIIRTSRTADPRGTRDGCLYTTARHIDANRRSDLRREFRLATLRRYILVIQGCTLPDDAYVTYQRGGECWWIDRKDEISQTNLLLLGQILTIQAAPVAQPALQPTVNVGAR